MEYSELKEKYSDSVLIGKGSTSNCYKLNELEVYKEYMDFYRPIIGDSTYEKLTEYKRLKMKYITFLTEIVTEDNLVKGIMLPYKKGKSIYEISESTLLSTFMDDLSKLEKDVDEVTKESIKLRDLNFGNIIYNDGIHLIDTDEYERDDSNYLKYHNIHELYSNIFLYLITSKNFLDFFNKNKNSIPPKINELFQESIYFGMLKMEYFMNNFLDYLQNKCETEVKTVGDLRRTIEKSI